MPKGTPRLKARPHRRELLYERQGGQCGICQEPLDTPWYPDANIDHVQPKYHGGRNVLDNLQLAHPTCNQAKGATWPWQPTPARPDKMLLELALATLG